MQWLLTNWLWVLIGIAFVAMHVFGHGGHGGHGSGGRSQRKAADVPNETSDRSVKPGPGAHRH